MATPRLETVVVLFTRDLRLSDNPALAAACRDARTVVPLFVHDPAVPSAANRDRFLAQALADLRAGLRERGGDLVVRSGDPVAEAVRLARAVRADAVAVAADASRYARRRERRLADACAAGRIGLRTFPSVTVVAPDGLRPTGTGDHYKVFTPYWRAWEAARRRPVEPAPGRVTLPEGVAVGRLPAVPRGDSPGLPEGGERAGRRRLDAWLGELAGYEEHHDDLPGDRTSRLSPYLHFGCVSPRELAETVRGRDGADAYLRQLCWRDFHTQVLYAFPDLPDREYRRGAFTGWQDDPDTLAAWQEGRTGVPLVDAGMRQLRAEGWMHNRARLVTGAFLTKYLGLDWRAGGAWFQQLLVDADVANNYGNWQWVAGTGNDTRPNRRFNPVRQAERYDPDGDYVRRWVPELAGVPGKAVHQPWRLPGGLRRQLPYPPPLPGVAPVPWLDT